MSKFFISNNFSYTERVAKINKETFKINHAEKCNGLSFMVFDKLSLHSENFYGTNRGGCYVIGTQCIGDPLSDEWQNIPKYIFENFSLDNIDKLKKEIIGIWAAFVWKDNQAYCFNDYYGLYDICYSSKSDFFVISTSLSDIHACYPNAEYDEYAFIMDNFLSFCFPGKTSFKGICKLKEDEFLDIENGHISIKKYHRCPITYDYKNMDSALQDISNDIKKYARLINEQIGRAAILMTGGLDSRLCLAAFNTVDKNVLLAHGLSPLTFHEDRDIVEKISKVYGGEMILLDWSVATHFNLTDQHSVFREVGFSNWISYGCKHTYDEEKRLAAKAPFLQSGYFCEAMRLRDWAEKSGKNYFSLEDYIDTNYLNDNLRPVYAHFEDFREYIIEQHKIQLNEIGFQGDYNHIPMDYFERFRWKMARYCDSRYTFMINSYQYSFLLMAVPFIHEAVLSLPADVIRNGQFQIRLIETLDEKLVKDFNVFSHNRPFKIRNHKKIRTLTVANCADKFVELFPAVRPFIRNLYHAIRNNEVSVRNSMLDDIQPMKDLLPSYINIDNYKGSLRNIRAFLIGVNYNRNIK